MNPEREQDFLLGEFGKYYFDMSSLNGGWNGVSASLTTNTGGIFQKAIFQFDDGMVAEGNWLQTSAIMMEVIQGKTKKKVVPLTEIPETEIVWALDSRCNHPGPARGFLAFQRRIAGDAMNILCMGMKKEMRDYPDKNNLNLPTVFFVPHDQKPISEEYPAIHIPKDKQRAFDYLVWRLYHAQKKANMPPLGQALDHAEKVFLDTFEPESIAKIKQTFRV